MTVYLYLVRPESYYYNLAVWQPEAKKVLSCKNGMIAENLVLNIHLKRVLPKEVFTDMM